MPGVELLRAAASSPHAALRLAVGGPLHPGGPEATEALLDRAGVGGGDRLVDLGCGAGAAVARARERGARAWGLDAEGPGADVRARLERLPLAADSLDVVLSECALCLAGDLDAAIGEVARVLAPGGRLAFGDVTVDRELPEVPRAVAEPLCLTGPRRQADLVERLEGAGLAVEDVETHADELQAMRDRVHERVDVDGLLAALGERGERLRGARDAIEDALDAGEIGYASVVARARA